LLGPECDSLAVEKSAFLALVVQAQRNSYFHYHPSIHPKRQCDSPRVILKDYPRKESLYLSVGMQHRRSNIGVRELG
jgi:hypothetical protein